MTELKSRLLPKGLFRRSSASSAKSVPSTASVGDNHRSRSKTSLLLSPKLRKGSVEPLYEEDAQITLPPSIVPASLYFAEAPSIEPQELHSTSLDASDITPIQKETPAVTLEEATPDPLRPLRAVDESEARTPPIPEEEGPLYPATTRRPDVGTRQQSLTTNNQKRFVRTLLEADKGRSRSGSNESSGRPPTLSASMLHRKIWVRRPGASATLVVISEDDLVDDVREMILRKYANSLGRSFDAPDVTLRVVPRDHSRRHSTSERTLGPEEPITRTLDAYYPGGQTVDEALLIDVPQRQTPRHSPRVHMPYYVTEDIRPVEASNEYFPPMPPGGQSPNHPSNLSVHSNAGNGHVSHAMSIINTGQPPSLPSPGGRGIRHTSNRPKYARNHTTSPTVITNAAAHAGKCCNLLCHVSEPDSQANASNRSENRSTHSSIHISPQPLPTPPIPTATQRSASPPPRVSSPRPSKPNRAKKNARMQPNLPKGLLDGAVPPINVLIVEDNIINLRLLEAFMKRLKVRWQTAMNGREAVTKWRNGGFHLVLMDIQLPIMNGLEATKEIRRLERVNEIGVLAATISGRSSVTGTRSVDGDVLEKLEEDASEEDRLMNTALFKSPVIIVALTASSLQSDRHEALAAGCNDFLTKVWRFLHDICLIP